MAVSGFRVQQIINPNTSALMHSPAPQKPRQHHQPLIFSPTLLEALSQGHCSSMKISHYGKCKMIMDSARKKNSRSRAKQKANRRQVYHDTSTQNASSPSGKTQLESQMDSLLQEPCLCQGLHAFCGERCDKSPYWKVLRFRHRDTLCMGSEKPGWMDA